MTVFDTIADAFSKDGAVTRFAEQIPVVGHVTAGIQAIAGNTEEAKRGLATSTGNLISTAGAIGGFVVGGPPGAVAGGSLSGLAGTFVTSGIAGSINDAKVKGDLGDVTLGKVVTNVGLGAASGLIPGGGGLVKSGGQALGKELIKDTAKVGVLKGLKGLAPITSTKVGQPSGDKMRKRISAINKQKSDACATHLYAMNTKYSVTPISGPAVNTAQTLEHGITIGQDWVLGTDIFTDAFRYFDARFYPGQPQLFMGGINRAITDLMNQANPGRILVNGVHVQYTEVQLRNMLAVDEAELVRLRGIAGLSFETEYDEF